MLCESCQTNEASVHLKEVRGDDHTVVRHLCAFCAAQYKLQHPDGDTMKLTDLVGELLSGEVEQEDSESQVPGSQANPDEITEEVGDHEGASAAWNQEDEVGAADPGHRFSDAACPECGFRMRQFRREGRLGCAECYNAFAGSLDEFLGELHGERLHRGRTPDSPGSEADSDVTDPETVRLRADLARAVDAEDYERAARLRDIIDERKRACQ